MTVLTATGTVSPHAPMVLWDNILDRGTLTGTPPATGYFRENLLGPQTYDFWLPSQMPFNMKCVLPNARNFDCAIFANHNLGSVGATRIYLQWRLDAADSWKMVFDLNNPTDENICALMPTESGGEFQWSCFGATAPLIGLWYVGKRVIFPAPVVGNYSPIYHAEQIETLVSQSLGGHYLNSSGFKKGAAMNVEFGPVKTDFLASNSFLNFQNHFNQSGPFFWAADPVRLPADIGYCWRPEGGAALNPAYAAGGYGALNMGLAAYVA